MSDAPTPQDAARLLARLAQARPGHHEEVTPEGLTAELVLLRAWQSNRLAQTYQDLLTSKRYRPAAEFFLSDIYAPRDFSQRNADLERFHDGVSKVLPERAVSILADAVELYQLSDNLDADMARVLTHDLGATETITAAQYSEAYRILDNYDDRLRQIRLVGQIGRGVDKLVQIPFVGMSLRLAHTPAVLAGWSELQGFLERGYSAFKHMKGAEGFLGTVEGRETAILDAIFAGSDDPFAAAV
jgi:hypothetical protein